MFGKLVGALDHSEVLAWQAKFADLAIVLDVGDGRPTTIRIADGRITVEEGAAEGATLRFAASLQAWRKFARVDPPAGFQTVYGMFGTHNLDVTGDVIQFSRYMPLIEGVFRQLRPEPTRAPPKVAGEPVIEPIAGRYVRLDIGGRPHRVYFEEAGDGIPLLCLHTAGADGRQYRHLLNDPEITARYRVIAFDLPWHGKSSPPEGFQDELYTLTTDRYVDTVMAVKRALGLEKPVLMGCSIGGRVVLHLALRHGAEFRAAVGLQSALYAEGRQMEGLDGMSQFYRPDLHGSEVAAAACSSSMAPQSPAAERWETLWYYMQGGPGVFMGDLYYYFVDGDLRNGAVREIDTKACPLYLLSGEYDLTAPPDLGAALAREVGATHFEVMTEVGHFPMSENPEHFRRYLLPILDRIHAAG